MNGGSAMARVRVDPAIFVMALLVVLADSVAEWAMVMACLVAHELAHAAAATGFGLRVEEVRLSALGASARMESGAELRPEVEATVAMAGPMASLVMAAVGIILWRGRELHGRQCRPRDVQLAAAFPQRRRALRALAQPDWLARGHEDGGEGQQMGVGRHHGRRRRGVGVGQAQPVAGCAGSFHLD